jgi:hypothetical protein
MEAVPSVTSETSIRFIDDCFPLVLSMGPRVWQDTTIDDMAAGYERFFARGERYALISAAPRGSVFGAKHRKQVADWSNSPRVRQKSGELCIGSATLARDALSRGALTAVLWLFKPPSPHQVVATPEEGVDWCIAKLQAAGIALPRSAAGLRSAALAHFAQT